MMSVRVSALSAFATCSSSAISRNAGEPTSGNAFGMSWGVEAAVEALARIINAKFIKK